MMKYLTTVLIALVAGFAGAAAFTYSGLGDAKTREYLVSNPDILPEMAAAYQTQESRQQLASIEDSVSQPFEGAVLGNPDGSTTLVKFTDYACGYCRSTVADIDRLIAADPDLRVVVREWPIFNGSEAPARMGLAAAKQGKYDAFYHALFELGTPSEENVIAAARIAGLDLAAAQEYSMSDEVTAELVRNDGFARQLGFGGTPSWVIGDQVFEGAVGYDRLAQYVEDAEG